jgi:uncharacterized protein (TIGR03437 family)
MAVLKTQYTVRVGESIEVPVPADTRDFILHAKTRRITSGGQDVPGLVMAPNETQDKILLAPNSKATPGDYTVTLSATDATGSEMAADVTVSVQPRQAVPLGSSRNPVVLLNGWIAGYTGTCTISSNSTVTFGNLAQYLVQDGAPIVYLFDNCAEDANQSIETLGQDLASFLASIKYSDGTAVTSFDLVAHSIGGLIVRSYLEGLQTNEAYLPPYNSLVSHLVLIGVPNFGSYVVANNSTQFETGSQGAELVPGSALLWNLATWNQRGDDLAGVSAIAVVGNAGTYQITSSTTQLLNASDGLVSTTSASMGFVIPAPKVNPTRIVPYCQVDPVVFTTTLLGTFNCNAVGIANVTGTTHETGLIVRSFLAGNTNWESVGTSPTADTWLKADGGAYFALQGVTAAYAHDLTAVTLGGITMTNGGNLDTIYYTDFATVGSGDFTATSTSLGTFNCGTLAVPAGTFSSFRCKLNLAIACPPGSTTCTGAVEPVTTPGVAVTSGSTITITGEDFGSQCGTCKIYATPAAATSPTTLTVTSWSNTKISAQLPASLTGYQILQVNAVAGVDSIGVRALAASTSPSLSVTPTNMNFAYTVGGATPATQSFAISNSGAGTLTWSAAVPSADATWLSVDVSAATAPSTVTVSVDPTGLAAGTYTGNITITATGAANSPATVTVTLVVSGTVAVSPVLVVAPTSLTFSYAAPGTAPAAQSLSIANSGGGSFTWTASSGAYWATLSAASGAVPASPTVAVTPGNLAPGSYNTNITVAAADNSVTPVTVTVTLTVTGTPPTPSITSVANAGGYQTNFASATWVAIFGTNLSQVTYSWQASDIVNGALPTTLEGVSVTIDGIPAYISYIGPGQINVLAPDDANLGSVQVVVTTAGQVSNAFGVQKVQFSPAFLTFDGTNIAATDTSYNLIGPANLLSGATTTPATPGETIVLYGVGFGPSSPALPTGTQVTTSEPLANTVTMTIGGVAVTPSFAGLTASGLYQFNVTVPPGLAAGNAAVVATIGGVSSPTGKVIAVQ